MNPRRPFVVVTPTDHEFVRACNVADALQRARVPRKKAIAVFDESILVDFRRAAAQMHGAPCVVIIGRAPPPQAIG